MEKLLILAINPGSTSTKIGLFQNTTPILTKTIRHDIEELKNYPTIPSQKNFRMKFILQALKEANIDPETLDGIVGIGGLLPTIDTGGYLITENLKRWVMDEKGGSHASNLGLILADELSEEAGCDAYIYDAVSAGYLPEVASITGMKEIKRKSLSHVLNSRAQSIEYAEKIGKNFSDLNVIIAHLGGGISLSIYEKGTLKDSLGDDIGPFSPERAGAIPIMAFVDKFYGSKISKDDIKKKIRGGGGFVSHLGTNNSSEVEEKAKCGNEKAQLLIDAMCYNVAKSIGSLSVVTKGEVDVIILTGGIANSENITSKISEQVKFIAPVEIMPGEYELEALARGCYRILIGEEEFDEWR
ncbi:MAG: butyrate kinase [Defluviitaleaceae bacterium]|nr:butyrate kinase [Defluviitaleaceae bacterium]